METFHGPFSNTTSTPIGEAYGGVVTAAVFVVSAVIVVLVILLVKEQKSAKRNFSLWSTDGARVDMGKFLLLLPIAIII